MKLGWGEGMERGSEGSGGEEYGGDCDQNTLHAHMQIPND